MRELRGQVTILDFWTYCCVNCMHVLPVLRQIEERFAGEPVVVLGIHSAKFDSEKDASRIEQAMRRYDVHHPVLVDRDMRTWQAFAIRSWPTLVVVRPDGTIAAVAPGEPDAAVLGQFIEAELERARRKGQLADAPFSVEAVRVAADSALSYPGKVAVASDGRIAVSDSGHHRVLVLDGQGHVLEAIGSGLSGNVDGPFADAAFDDPQGLAFGHEGELYVADARAHTIRRVDFHDRRVTTIAGTGALGVAPLAGRRPARETPLRSPWDIVKDGERLIVAMAGSHQIAVLDLEAGTIERLAGTGAESIVDGSFANATFSQPSGLALIGRSLYVADSETSAVRELSLDSERVRTVVGRGLFDFGDRDGARDVALMQHCIGIAAGPGERLLVADTYNDKLRFVDRQSGAVRTFFEGGLAEPAGLAWDPSRSAWIVADTNHHRLLRVTEDGSAAVIAITGAPTPQRGAVRAPEGARRVGGVEWFTTQLEARDGASLAPGDGTIEFVVRAPTAKKFSTGSPISLSLEVSRRSDLLIPHETELQVEASGAPEERVRVAVRVEPLDVARIESELVVRIDGVTCDVRGDEEGAACEPHRAWLRIPVRLAQAGAALVTFDAT
jgi:sugar lactone lactonase YvrE